MEGGGTVNHTFSTIIFFCHFHRCCVFCLTLSFTYYIYNTFLFFSYVPVWLPDRLMGPQSITTNSGFLLDMMEMPGKHVIPLFTQHWMANLNLLQHKQIYFQSKTMGFVLNVTVNIQINFFFVCFQQAEWHVDHQSSGSWASMLGRGVYLCMFDYNFV